MIYRHGRRLPTNDAKYVIGDDRAHGMTNQHDGLSRVLPKLINQPLTGCAAEILVFIIGSKVLQFSFENEIANLVHTSMQV